MKKGPVQAAATPHRNPDLLKDQFQHSTGAYLLAPTKSEGCAMSRVDDYWGKGSIRNFCLRSDKGI